MWKIIFALGRPQMTVWRMRFAWWIPKATLTHSEYVILTAFPRQQWLHERASVLRLYVLCLVVFVFMEGFFLIEIFASSAPAVKEVEVKVPIFSGVTPSVLVNSTLRF
jgi:hypothetical protein